jgi:dUTP pyrophosphatase
MQVRIRRRDPRVALPRYQTPGSAGFDLAAAEDATIQPGEIRLIRTGLVVEVPDGHFLAVIARSSTPLRRGLVVANAVGVIDSDYCGPDDEVLIEVMNVTRAAVAVAFGDRLAQGLILPVARAEWVEVTGSDRPTRGGVGSTGSR